MGDINKSANRSCKIVFYFLFNLTQCQVIVTAENNLSIHFLTLPIHHQGDIGAGSYCNYLGVKEVYKPTTNKPSTLAPTDNLD